MSQFIQHAYKPRGRGKLLLDRMHPHGDTLDWCLVGESCSRTGPENVARLFLWTGKPSERPAMEAQLVGIVGSRDTDGLGSAARRLRAMVRRWDALNAEMLDYAAGALREAIRAAERADFSALQARTLALQAAA